MKSESNFDLSLIDTIVSEPETIIRTEGSAGKNLLSEKMFRLLVENACDILSLHSIDGKDCLYVNSTITRILGYLETELVGQTAFEFQNIIYDEDKEELQRLFSQTLAKGESSCVLRYLKKSGQYHWFEVASKLLYDDEPVIFLRSHDINQQKYVEEKMEKQYQELVQGYEQIEQLNAQLHEYQIELLDSNSRLKESEEKLGLALWGGNGCLWEWDIVTGSFYINDKWSNILGYDNSQLNIIAKEWIDLIHPDDYNQVAEALQSYLQAKVPYLFIDSRIKNGAGDYIWMRITGKMVFQDNKGKTLRIVGLFQDINDQKQAQQEKLASDNKYKELFDKNPIGLCNINKEGKITDANAALIRMLGASSAGELTDINVIANVENKIADIFNQFLKNEKPGSTVTGELKFNTRWGKEVWIYYWLDPILDEEGLFKEAMLACEEITERKQAEDRIRFLSFNDSITGLYNRAFYEEELKRLDTRRQLPLTIIMGDVNGLKLINDAFGHKQGDLALRKIAEVLRSSCRQEDIIARLGGDEFVVLLPKTSAHIARNICRRIKDNCKRIQVDNMNLSIALGMFTKESIDQKIEDIERESEERMYRNKLLENRTARNSFIGSLEETLWSRGHETREHSIRMQEIIQAISNSLGLKENDLENLQLLTALHDIGKIAISSNILEKDTDLTDDEWETIKKHPEIGYRIALSAPELAPIAEAILTHHENWDGTGYPLQLTGENIPLLARILAIVDAYDVMRNGRPYRVALSKEKALEEIMNCAGTRFDPKLAEIFIDEVSAREDL